jgi:hypothetical protein
VVHDSGDSLDGGDRVRLALHRDVGGWRKRPADGALQLGNQVPGPLRVAVAAVR